MAVTDKNIVTVKKIIEEDNEVTYEVIEHQLQIGFLVVRTIIDDNLHLKKVVSRFVPHHIFDFQKAEHVRLWRETFLKQWRTPNFFQNSDR